MPNRIIRESARSSRTLALCIDDALTMWPLLITCSDDFGCFDAHPAIVRGACFPYLMDRWTEPRVEGALDSLASVAMIVRWDAGGRRLGCFVHFEKHNRRRSSNRKYPEPPANMLTTARQQNDSGVLAFRCHGDNTPLQSADYPEPEPESYPEPEPEESVSPPAPVPTYPDELVAIVDRFPKLKGTARTKALAAVADLVRIDRHTLPEIAALITWVQGSDLCSGWLNSPTKLRRNDKDGLRWWARFELERDKPAGRGQQPLLQQLGAEERRRRAEG